MIKGAIFDLDGTVLDSMGLWHKVDVAFFENRNMEIPEGYIQAISPLGTYKAAVYTKETYNIKESVEEIIAEWQIIAKNEYSKNVKLKNGAKEYILSLKEKGVKLAVATASDPDMFSACLKKYGIWDAFQCIVTVNEVGQGKSNPEIYLRAAEKLGVSVDECAVFEDISVALKTAKSAGFYCVGVYDSSSEKDIEENKKIADKFIFNFNEMDV